MDKPTLRRMLRARRQALPAEVLATAGDQAARQLVARDCWRRARTVALHVACRGELPTEALIAAARAAGKRVALPRMAGGRMELRLATPGVPLVAGAHGIPEPHAGSERIGSDEPDLVLAPGLAFDREGRRLGQGGGDYDRLLAAVRADCAKVGWCHAFQLVEHVPSEPHDEAVQLVVTPDGAHGPAA